MKKTKEMIVDIRRKTSPHQPLYIQELEVNRVSSFKCLGIRISEDFTWSLNTVDIIYCRNSVCVHLIKKSIFLPQFNTIT